MDTAEIVVLVVGSLLIAFTRWFFFGQRDDVPRSSTTGAKSKEPLYACPMHSWITSHDANANCSICGIKLSRIADKKLDTT